MPRAVFLAAPVRTPIGKFGGALASRSAVELGEVVARECLRRAGVDPGHIDEVIFGNGRQAGVGPNPARQVGYRAGCPETVPAFTVNKACGSSLKTILLAAQSIALERAEVVLTGGMESMSNMPYFLTGARWGYRLGHEQLVDGMYRDGFLCPLCGQVMGETAENLAEMYGISRRQQDEYAANTQQRCEAARRQGKFQDELTPVEWTDSKGRVQRVEMDEHPRDGVTVESLARLKPVFKENGTVHAGNSSGIVDGAAAVLVVSESAAVNLQPGPMARIVDYAVAGVKPEIMGIAPVPAVRKLLEKNRLSLKDIDLIELNEAFAVQVLACHRDLQFDLERLNVNGGAIALGHPIGATGARITVTLMHEMHRRQAHYGLATLCISGGQGLALLLERV